MDKTTTTLYATIVCAAFAVLTFILTAIYGYHPWREARDRRRAQRGADGVMTARPVFIPLGTASVFLLLASGIFFEAWLYFSVKAAHPRLYWVYAALVSLAIFGVGNISSRLIGKLFEDGERARASGATAIDYLKAEVARIEKSHRAEIAHKDTFLAGASADTIKLQKQLENKDAECEEKLRTRTATQEAADVLAVGLEPTVGKSDKMFLKVTNKGPEQQFYAQCSILENPESPKLQTVFDLGWEGSVSIKTISLNREQVGKLLIAAAGEDRVRNFSWMTLRALGGENIELERWEKGGRNTGLSYRLRITVFGVTTKTSKSKGFILRPGQSCALEMVAIACEDGKPSLLNPLQLEIFELARELRDFLKKMGPRPAAHISTDETTLENIRKANAAIQPWLLRLTNTYAAEFADRVQKVIHRLAAENLTDADLDAAASVPNNETKILGIAERLQLLEVKLDYMNDRKDLRA